MSKEVKEQNKPIILTNRPLILVCDGHSIAAKNMEKKIVLSFFQIDPFSNFNSNGLTATVTSSTSLDLNQIKKLKEDLENAIKEFEK